MEKQSSQKQLNTGDKQWKNNEITEDEKLLVKRCLGFFAGSESLVGNNLLLSAFRYVTDAECRQYILRQAFEESLHNLTIVYICDSLDLDIDEVFTAYETIPSIKANGIPIIIAADAKTIEFFILGPKTSLIGI